jgi:putative addiction module component (TIGR02574 family)
MFREVVGARFHTMAQATQILEAALDLPPRERADLVEAIAASLEGFDLGGEWEAEIRQRIQEVDSGRVQPISGEEALSRIEQRLRARS